jgi:putative hydrolase of HD superfamily
MALDRDIEFLYEIASLRNVPRGWRQHLGLDCASVLEHTLRVIFIALSLAKKEGVEDVNKIIKMALVHDLDETRISDLSYVQKVYVEGDEERAFTDMFGGTSFEEFLEINKEYTKRESLESKIVKDADNLDIDFELKELDQKGSKLPSKFVKLRKDLRDKKLYTKSAKDLWDKIQESDPDAWHLKNNKYLKIPNSGL